MITKIKTQDGERLAILLDTYATTEDIVRFQSVLISVLQCADPNVDITSELSDYTQVMQLFSFRDTNIKKVGDEWVAAPILFE